MEENPILPSPHKILSVLHHADLECTFRVACKTQPDYGQFYMLSLPKVGEAPISASGKGPGYVEFTIRKVGLLTQAIFDLVPGNSIFLRGPYGNAFPVSRFENKDLVVICGGTGMAPVLTMLNHFYDHPEICKSVHLLVGFRNMEQALFINEIRKFQERFDVIPTLYYEEAPGFETGKLVDHICRIPISSFTDYNIVIVGSPYIMGVTSAECLKNGADEKKIWVSFERKMSCGVGKCGHCKVGEKYVCLDGPVFNYSEAKSLLD